MYKKMAKKILNLILLGTSQKMVSLFFSFACLSCNDNSNSGTVLVHLTESHPIESHLTEYRLTKN
jgi:hypothetical protein